MRTCKSLFLAIIMLPVVIQFSAIKSNILDCYVCDNSDHTLPGCERGPPVMSTVVAIKSFDSAKNDCKTVDEFFNQQAYVETEWYKRYPELTLPEELHPRRPPKPRQLAGTALHCASMNAIVTGSDGQERKLIYRDCVRGNKADIEERIKGIFHIEMKGGSDQCAQREITLTQDQGTKRTQLCVCETSKCNDKPVSGAINVTCQHALPLVIVHLFVLSMISYFGQCWL